MDSGVWRWNRRITVRYFPSVTTRDLRICTVRMFRMRKGDLAPGESMAEVSSVIRTIGDAFPTTQVYDVYLLALENVPGWWVYMDAIQPFLEATLTDPSVTRLLLPRGKLSEWQRSLQAYGWREVGRNALTIAFSQTPTP